MNPEFFRSLQASAVAQAVAKSNHLVGAALQVAHILGLLLLLASVLLLTLRAFGLGRPRLPAGPLVADTRRLFWIGFILMATSGSLIFLSSAIRYSTNAAFELKVLLLVAAIIAQLAAQRRLSREDSDGHPGARGAAVLTLVLWFGVAGAGRAIGYI